MASNLNVNVTADATQMRSALALARADLNAYSADIRKVSQEMRASGQTQSAELDRVSALWNKAKADVAKYGAAVVAANAQAVPGIQAVTAATETATTAHGKLKIATAGTTQEMIVLAHEVVQGNFSRMPGSVMVMAEQMGGLHILLGRVTPAMWAVGGATAALAAGFGYLAFKAHEAKTALNAVYLGTLAIAGNADAARFAVEGAVAAMPRNSGLFSGLLSASSIREGAVAMQTMTGVTDQTRDALTRLYPALYRLLNLGDVAKTNDAITKAFGSTASIDQLIVQMGLVKEGDLARYAAAKAAGSATDMQAIAIEGLNRRFGQSEAQIKASTDAMNEWRRTNARESLAGIPEARRTPMPGLAPFGQADMRSADPPMSQAMRDQLALIGQITTGETELAALELRRTRQAEILARTTNEADRDIAQQVLNNINIRIQEHKAAGDVDWLAKQTAALAASKDALLARARTHKELTASMQRTEVEFWANVLRDTRLTAGQRTQAEKAGADARRQQRMQELQTAEAGGKAGLEAKLAALSTEQSADRQNLAFVIQIQNMKLALIRAAHGETSKMYQDELRRGDDAIKAALASELQLVQQAGHRAAEIKKASLDEQVALGQITKAEEAVQLQRFVVDQQQAELAVLNDAIAKLDEGTNARAEALRQRTKMEQDFAVVLQKLRTQEVRDSAAAADRTAKDYLSAFSGVEGAFKNIFGGMISGTMTWAKATGMILKSVFEGFLDLGLKMVGRWIVTQLAMTHISSAATQARVATEIASGGSGWGALLASWFGFNAKKDVIAVGSEAVQTEAVVAGAAARTTANVASATVSGAAEKASALGSIGTSAAAAAANGPIRNLV